MFAKIFGFLNLGSEEKSYVEPPDLSAIVDGECVIDLTDYERWTRVESKPERGDLLIAKDGHVGRIEGYMGRGKNHFLVKLLTCTGARTMRMKDVREVRRSIE